MKSRMMLPPPPLPARVLKVHDFLIIWAGEKPLQLFWQIIGVIHATSIKETCKNLQPHNEILSIP